MTAQLTQLTQLPAQLTALSFPAPPGSGVWHLGPFPLRGYALCIIAGILLAIWIGERRWVARGGAAGQVQDLALWAVPFGLVGGRAYHVATDWEKYFGEGRNPVTALYVWKGGLGIWGAIALGAVGVYIWARRNGVSMPAVADVLAPGIIVAQAVGRWGNWFNQELYGKPTTLPWGLEVTNDQASPANRFPAETLFHPTFLYECLWNLAVFGLLIWAERRWRLGHGRVFALYVMGYTLGRGWIEYLRIDDVQLNDVLGLRFNVWTSIVLFLAALVAFVVSARRHPGEITSLYRSGWGPAGRVAETDAEAEEEAEQEADQDVAAGAGTGSQATPATATSDEPVEDDEAVRHADEDAADGSATTTRSPQER